MELKLDGSVFDADLERTRTYYQSNTLLTAVTIGRTSGSGVRS